MWYELLWFIWFPNMSEQGKTYLNLFRINMIWIDTILEYVKTWRNTLKLSKWHKEVHWQSYSLDRFDERAVKKPIRLRDYLCPLRIEDCKWTCIFHVHRNLFKISIHLFSFLSNLILNFLYIPTCILHSGA